MSARGPIKTRHFCFRFSPYVASQADDYDSSIALLKRKTSACQRKNEPSALPNSSTPSVFMQRCRSANRAASAALNGAPLRHRGQMPCEAPPPVQPAIASSSSQTQRRSSLAQVQTRALETKRGATSAARDSSAQDQLVARSAQVQPSAGRDAARPSRAAARSGREDSSYQAAQPREHQ